jgi:hypothetical protein
MQPFAETLASENGCMMPTEERSCRGALPMRDLMLAASPLAAVLYFLVNQDQFGELVGWAETFIH